MPRRWYALAGSLLSAVTLTVTGMGPAHGASACGSAADVAADIAEEAAALPDVAASQRLYDEARAAREAAQAAATAAATALTGAKARLVAANTAVAKATAAVAAAKRTAGGYDDYVAAIDLKAALAEQSAATTAVKTATATAVARSTAAAAAETRFRSVAATHAGIVEAARSAVRAQLHPCVARTVDVGAPVYRYQGNYELSLVHPVVTLPADYNWVLLDVDTGTIADEFELDTPPGRSSAREQRLIGGLGGKVWHLQLIAVSAFRPALRPLDPFTVDMRAYPGQDRDSIVTGSWFPGHSPTRDAYLSPLTMSLNGFAARSAVTVTVDGRAVATVTVDGDGHGDLGPTVLMRQAFGPSTASGTLHVVHTVGRKSGDTRTLDRDADIFYARNMAAPGVTAVTDPHRPATGPYGNTNFFFTVADSRAAVEVACTSAKSPATITQLQVAVANDPADFHQFRYIARDHAADRSTAVTPGAVCRLTSHNAPASLPFTLPAPRR